MDFMIKYMLQSKMKNNNRKQINICNKSGEECFLLNESMSKKYIELLDFFKEKEIKNYKINNVADIINKEFKNNYEYTYRIDNHVKNLRNMDLLESLLEIAPLLYGSYEIYKSLKKLNSKIKFLPFFLVLIYMVYLLHKKMSTDYIKKEITELRQLGIILLNNRNKELCLELPRNYKPNNTLLYELLQNVKNKLNQPMNESMNEPTSKPIETEEIKEEIKVEAVEEIKEEIKVEPIEAVEEIKEEIKVEPIESIEPPKEGKIKKRKGRPKKHN